MARRADSRRRAADVENGGVSEDLLTITWKLKEGVLWSDGTPFTSEDVNSPGKRRRTGERLGSRVGLRTDHRCTDARSMTAVVTYSEFNAGYLDQFP